MRFAGALAGTAFAIAHCRQHCAALRARRALHCVCILSPHCAIFILFAHCIAIRALRLTQHAFAHCTRRHAAHLRSTSTAQHTPHTRQFCSPQFIALFAAHCARQAVRTAPASRQRLRRRVCAAVCIARIAALPPHCRFAGRAAAVAPPPGAQSLPLCGALTQHARAALPHDAVCAFNAVCRTALPFAHCRLHLPHCIARQPRNYLPFVYAIFIAIRRQFILLFRNCVCRRAGAHCGIPLRRHRTPLPLQFARRCYYGIARHCRLPALQARIAHCSLLHCRLIRICASGKTHCAGGITLHLAPGPGPGRDGRADVGRTGGRAGRRAGPTAPAGVGGPGADGGAPGVLARAFAHRIAQRIARIIAHATRASRPAGITAVTPHHTPQPLPQSRPRHTLLSPPLPPPPFAADLLHAAFTTPQTALRRRSAGIAFAPPFAAALRRFCRRRFNRCSTAATPPPASHCSIAPPPLAPLATAPPPPHHRLSQFVYRTSLRHCIILHQALITGLRIALIAL